MNKNTKTAPRPEISQPGSSNGTKKTQVKPHVRLGFDLQKTTTLGQKLNDLLATYQVHYQKLRNFHWNISGDDFFEMHEYFERVYNSAKVNIDDIAERIKTLGIKPYSTLQKYIDHSHINEVEEVLPSKEMARSIVRDYEILIACIIDCHGIASANGDLATIKLLMNLSDEIEKHHWMLRTWSK